MVEESSVGLVKCKLPIGLTGKTMAELLKYLSITGPTGSGKSSLAKEIAKDLNGEIVNCDSVQIYKYFDIGSGKDTPKHQNGIRHHLLDVVEAHENFDAAQFARSAKKVILEILSRNKLPIVVGGTGLYLRALWGEKFHDLPSDKTTRDEIELLSNEDIMQALKQIDPDRANFLHLNDRIRLVRSLEIVRLTGKPLTATTTESTLESPPTCLVHIQPNRKILIGRIELRIRQMLKDGLIEEVKNLRAMGVSPESKPMKSICYLQTNQFLDGEIKSEEELWDKICIANRQYAKKQTTWFNKVEKDIEIFEPVYNTELKNKIKSFFTN